VLVPLVLLTLVAEPQPLTLAQLPDDAQLIALLWENSPELQLARTRVASARADLDRAHLLPNPAIDLSANTLPIGATNPPDLPSPLANVPNYALSLSTLIELGKRGPRQEATRRAVDAAVLDARALLLQRYYDLRDHLGEIAAIEQRIFQLSELAQDAAHLTAIQRARSDKGDASTLDSDRALLEEQKLAASLGIERARLTSELRACAEIAGSECQPFGDPGRASTFLARIVASPATLEPEGRPDVQSLLAQADSARAFGVLASRRAIPDPTLRVGYVRDQFVVSGNQPNSLFVGLSFALPLFDRGQADSQAAAVAAEAADRARGQVIQIAHHSLQQVDREANEVEQRRTQLAEKTLPLARNIVDRLDAAVQRGGAGLQDLLLARRSLGELVLDKSDLDLAVFRLGVVRSRISGLSPSLPAALTP
jgi:cobalt-zinc-cadmium efflux system outer membrane protein